MLCHLFLLSSWEFGCVSRTYPWLPILMTPLLAIHCYSISFGLSFVVDLVIYCFKFLYYRWRRYCHRTQLWWKHWFSTWNRSTCSDWELLHLLARKQAFPPRKTMHRRRTKHFHRYMPSLGFSYRLCWKTSKWRVKLQLNKACIASRQFLFLLARLALLSYRW